MPPRIRTRAAKAMKENIGIKENSKTKTSGKAPRKVLGDKTNSASDENVSVEVPVKSKALVHVLEKEVKRPRRERRLPTRYVKDQVLTNLSNSKESPNETRCPKVILTPLKVDKTPSKNETRLKVDKIPSKSGEPHSSPIKTPSKLESSLVANKPKRICRLPSRFDDHSISPHKYIPIKPSNASTPIQQSKAKDTKNDNKTNKQETKSPLTQPPSNKTELNTRPARAAKNLALHNKLSDSSTNASSPDTNNNAKGRSLRPKRGKLEETRPSPKKNSPNKIIIKKLRDKNLSFKVLEDKKTSSKNNENDLDVYEFTYDPNEEPKPQKKSRKHVPRKRPPKTNTVVYKNNYDKNINKALINLKNFISKNTPKPAETVKSVETQQKINIITTTPAIQRNVPLTDNTNRVKNTNTVIDRSNEMANDTGKESVREANFASIRVEDIAADIEPSIDQHDEINYSPVNSPQPKSPNLAHESQDKLVHVNDPLNLQEDFSFFDEQPVASSSMNVSVRHPLASPWRVEFGTLPMKWHVDAYVKSDMTPAVESSFISSCDSIKNKHVYTNLVPQASDTLPEIVTNTSNLKQSSIISFMREVAERNAQKKRGRSVSPTKFNSIFEDVPDLSNACIVKAPRNTIEKVTGKIDIIPEEDDVEDILYTNDHSEDKENSKEEKKKNRKRKNMKAISDKPAKSPCKQKNKDCTYFGFDDSENQEQENLSPLKVKNVRSMRTRMRPALHEMNSQTGPMRVALPVAAKTKIATNSDAVNKVFEDMKSAADAPEFPEKDKALDNVTTVDDQALNDDSQSVHLFEDIEVVHHLKPSRKSYTKAKKVTFRQRSLSDSESSTDDVVERNYSSDDDLADLTFEMPNIKEKKATKKKKPKRLMSKKEEKEADEWAAGFNSMCEDIEEFPLVVE